MWSIRFNAQWQKDWEIITDVERELQLALDTDLDEILNKLPLDWEIKKIFQDLISYRSIGSHLVKTEELREKIFEQRKLTEKGGCSVNSNILLLLSTYQREHLFCASNFIICNNSSYYKSLCYNAASGILNSFSTPASSIFGGLLVSTRVESLDKFMLEILIFDISNEKLNSALKGYDIETLIFDDSGVDYINSCLHGLNESKQSLYKSNEMFYPPLCNLLLLISKSQTEKIDKDLLYRILLKYWIFEFHIGYRVIDNLIIRYKPSKEDTNELISKMLYETHSTLNYTRSIGRLVSYISDYNAEFTDIRMDFFKMHKAIMNLIVIYRVSPDVKKPMLQTFCLDNIEDFGHYIRFVFLNHIVPSSDDKIREFYNKYKNGINKDDSYILAQIRKDASFTSLHSFIDEIAISNECLKFFLSPEEYKDFDNVSIDWLFKLDKKGKEEIFKNEIYKTKLKDYINTHWLSKSDMEYLISLL